MNERLQKLLTQIKDLWGKWSAVQKAILVGAIVVVVIVIVALVGFSAKPTAVPLFSTAITDQAVRDKIIYRVEEENVKVSVSNTGVISVPDEATARRMRSILVREDLVPTTVDPWELFDTERWTTTDFERNVNLQRSITNQIRQHIEALDEVDSAQVTITMPGDALFAEDQKKPTAAITIFHKPGSDIITDRKKIEGVQKLVLRMVEGLEADNVVISDSAGNILNDFAGMEAMDRIAQVEEQQKVIQRKEAKMRADVLKALQQTYTPDRVRDLNVKIDMDMSERISTKEEHTPFVLRADNPDTPYDDSEIVANVPISSETVEKVYKGTGYNPEGPAGVEGQNPPVYSDMSNLYGISTEKGEKVNYAINKEIIESKKSPTIDRVTVSVNIDGTWRKKYDDKGDPILTNYGSIEREYIGLTDDEILYATQLVQDAVGYDRTRGDSVTVVNIAYDRTEQFEKEDAAFLAKRQRDMMIMWTIIGIAALIVAFVLFRLISRELERRRRQKEEEMLRRHQMERERTLWEAEQAGMEVTMSVEERKRLELQENAITLAKEHPEDVALLVRTWLMEE